MIGDDDDDDYEIEGEEKLDPAWASLQKGMEAAAVDAGELAGVKSLGGQAVTRTHRFGLPVQEVTKMQQEKRAQAATKPPAAPVRPAFSGKVVG